MRSISTTNLAISAARNSLLLPTLVALIFLVFAAMLAGETPTPSATDVVTPRDEASQGIWEENFVKPFKKGWEATVAKKVEAGITLLALVAFTWLTKSYNKLRKRLAGPRFKLPKTQSDSYQRILLLAIGGTGKTQLVRSLFGYSDRHKEAPDPRVSTQGLRLYTLNHEVTSGDHASVCRLEIEDYRGQDITQISHHVSQQSHDPKALPFTSVILMVDLFETDEYRNEEDSELPEPVEDEPDTDRVGEHKRVWTNELLKAIISPLPRKLSSVFLIINKLDLLKDSLSPQKINGVRKRYQPLLDVLVNSIPGVKPEIIFTSAAKGWGMTKLLKQLILKADPIP